MEAKLHGFLRVQQNHDFFTETFFSQFKATAKLTDPVKADSQFVGVQKRSMQQSHHRANRTLQDLT